jgi:citrate lyase beta subunit
MAVIVAAVQAYIDQEDTVPERDKGHGLSAWKMGARKEQLGRRSLAARVNPLKTRLNRFSL